MPPTPQMPDMALLLPMDHLDQDHTIRNMVRPDQSYTVHTGVTLVKDDMFGTCFQFDGSPEAYIELPSFSPDYTNGLTIEAWVQHAAHNWWSRIVDFGNGIESDNICLANREGTNKLAGCVYSGNSPSFVDAPADSVPLGRWCHYAFTVMPDGKATLYRDGAVIASGSVSAPKQVVRTRNYIGKSNWAENKSKWVKTPDGYFQGKMAHLLVYPRALTQDEIARDMRAAAKPALLLPMDQLSKGGSTNTTPDMVHPGQSYPVHNGVTLVQDDRFGMCFQFDGSPEAYIDLSSFSPDYTRGLTIEAWVQYAELKSWSRIVDFGNGQDSNNIYVANRGKSAQLSGSVYSDNRFSAVDGPADSITTDRWFHVAFVVWPDGKATLYRDGSPLASGSVNVPKQMTRTKNYIGKSNWPWDEYFKGKMAHLLVYTYPLVEGEVNRDMNAAHKRPALSPESGSASTPAATKPSASSPKTDDRPSRADEMPNMSFPGAADAAAHMADAAAHMADATARMAEGMPSATFPPNPEFPGGMPNMPFPGADDAAAHMADAAARMAEGMPSAQFPSNPGFPGGMPNMPFPGAADAAAHMADAFAHMADGMPPAPSPEPVDEPDEMPSKPRATKGRPRDD